MLLPSLNRYVKRYMPIRRQKNLIKFCTLAVNIFQKGIKKTLNPKFKPIYSCTSNTELHKDDWGKDQAILDKAGYMLHWT